MCYNGRVMCVTGTYSVLQGTCSVCYRDVLCVSMALPKEGGIIGLRHVFCVLQGLCCVCYKGRALCVIRDVFCVLKGLCCVCYKERALCVCGFTQSRRDA